MDCRASLILALLLFAFHAKAQEEKDPTLQIVRGIVYDNEKEFLLSHLHKIKSLTIK